MIILKNLTPAEEARLSTEAMQNGLAPEELIQKLLREHLTAKSVAPVDLVRAKLHQWQKETDTATTPQLSAHELFGRWDEEASQMTDTERDAEDRLWQDFMKNINETRATLGMRQL